MKIIGIGGSDHDLSACLLVDGKLEIAIEEERLSREKHGRGIRSCLLKSVDYCLKELNLDYKDIDYFFTSDLFYPRIAPPKMYIDKLIKINHHYTHAACAYYLSGFEEAAWLVIDGGGSRISFNTAETVTYGYINSYKITTLQKVLGRLNTLYDLGYQSNSLGSFYDFFNLLCGFGIFEAGKLMGLASYGKPSYINEIKKLVNIRMAENHQVDIKIELNREIYKDFYKIITDCKELSSQFQIKADFAASAQILLEEWTYMLMEALYQQTHNENLCYSGGVAYNSVLNGKIKANTSFKNIFIPPAAGDSGTAIGAALYGYHNILGNSVRTRKQITSMYTGKTYSSLNIKEAVSQYQKEVDATDLGDQIFNAAAKDLCDEKIIGWFQGGSEFGPRALGNRSILADARLTYMKDKLNTQVKFRESFRPFAPVVLQNSVNEYFISDFEYNPFMLYVGKVRPDKKSVIPAVVHIDETARLQTINKINNAYMYLLLCAYKKMTGIPVILNTSFNTKGKPIVETPKDAIKCLLESGLDTIYVGTYKITKKSNV